MEPSQESCPFSDTRLLERKLQGDPDVEVEAQTLGVLTQELGVALGPRLGLSVLRRLDLVKPPGVAETIDWAQALEALGCAELEPAVVESTLGSVLKHHEDLLAVRDAALAELVEEARAASH